MAILLHKIRIKNSYAYTKSSAIIVRSKQEFKQLYHGKQNGLERQKYVKAKLLILFIYNHLQY